MLFVRDSQLVIMQRQQAFKQWRRVRVMSVPCLTLDLELSKLIKKIPILLSPHLILLYFRKLKERRKGKTFIEHQV